MDMGESSLKVRRREVKPLHPSIRRDSTHRSKRSRRLLLSFVLLVFILSIFLSLRGPLARLYEWEGRLREAERRLEEERALTRSLEERLEKAHDPSFLERRARELGYVRPGEIPLVVEERKR